MALSAILQEYNKQLLRLMPKEFLEGLRDIAELRQLIVASGDGLLCAVLSKLMEERSKLDSTHDTEVLAFGNGTENVITTYLNTRIQSAEQATKLHDRFLGLHPRNALPLQPVSFWSLACENFTVAEQRGFSSWHVAGGTFVTNLLESVESKRHMPFGKNRMVRKLAAGLDFGLQLPQIGETQIQLANGSTYSGAEGVVLSGDFPRFTQFVDARVLTHTGNHTGDYVLTIGKPNMNRCLLTAQVVWDACKIQFGSNMPFTTLKIVPIERQGFTLQSSELIIDSRIQNNTHPNSTEGQVTATPVAECDSGRVLLAHNKPIQRVRQ